MTVTDPDAYAGYQALAPAAFAAHGARFLARGGAAEADATLSACGAQPASDRTASASSSSGRNGLIVR